MTKLNLFDNHQFFKKLLKIRAFETVLLSLFSKNKIGGTTHTAIGQELSGVLVGMLAKKQDVIISNHRCHAHYLGLTADFKGLANELLGNSYGVNQGVGGSQHIAISNKFYSNGIQGGMVSYSAGLAKILHKKSNGVVINFIGDGTFGEGAVYEGLNIASSFKSPVLFFIENNEIAQTTFTKDVVSGRIEDKLKGFGIEYAMHKHDDIEGLYNSIDNFLADIRESSSPRAIIWNCQRLGPHSKSDDTRSDEDLQEMFEKDIIRKFHNSNKTSYENQLALSIQEVEPYFEIIKEPKNLVSNILKKSSYKKLLKKNHNNSNLLVDEINSTLECFLEDTNGIILGEDIIDPYGGAFKVTKGLSARFPDRVLSTSISESAIVGFGIGYSSIGGTVIIEIMFGDFVTLIADQLINHCSKFSFLHASSSPSIIIRTPIGGGRGYGATHSQSLEKIFGGIPNIHIEQISFMHSIHDCYERAINRKGCTIISEPKLQYSYVYNKLDEFSNAVFEKEYIYDDSEWLFLKSDLKDAISIVCTGITLPTVIKASKDLFLNYEILVNIISPRKTSPLFIPEKIKANIASKCIVVDEAYDGYGFCETFIANFSINNDKKVYFEKYCLEDNIYPSSLKLEEKFMINNDKLLSKIVELNEIHCP
jgi:2-oxoisovalerate dehydrogenase E1 component